MSTPLALQLYTVRAALEQNFAAVVKKVAEIGYTGVETAHFPGTTPEAARTLFDDLGLTVVAAHTALPVGEKTAEVLELAAALGCQRIICPSLNVDDYKTIAETERTCELINEANAIATEHGLSLGIHNHWWEYQPVEGQYPYQLLANRLDSSLFFELDTYWIKAAGIDPIEIVNQFKGRAPLLHIKDGPGVLGEPHVAVGEGVMDIPAVVKAGAGDTDWLIVELDHCATDMLTAVEQSYRYLTTIVA